MDSTVIMAFPRPYSSKPMAIPLTDLEREPYSLSQRIDVVRGFEKSNDEDECEHPRDTPESSELHSEEEFSPIPDGSPAFATVMSEMSSSMSKTSIRDQVRFPVLPDDNSARAQRRESVIAELPSNLTAHQRRQGSPDRNSEPRVRSYSWNFRSKTEADRRKGLSVSFQCDASSAHSSPSIVRRKKKPRLHSAIPHSTAPKYKILSENVAVSHDDLVREQERERHLAEGFAEVKSIFQSRHFDRLGISPKYSS